MGKRKRKRNFAKQRKSDEERDRYHGEPGTNNMEQVDSLHGVSGNTSVERMERKESEYSHASTAMMSNNGKSSCNFFC